MIENFIVPFLHHDRSGKLLDFKADVKVLLHFDNIYSGTININPIPMTYLYASFHVSSSELIVKIVDIISNSENNGHGTLMLSSLLNTVRQLEDITNTCCHNITGDLVPLDKKNGNWLKSLPLYQNLPSYILPSNKLSCTFWGNESQKTYLDYHYFMDENDSGHVIFTLRN